MKNQYLALAIIGFIIPNIYVAIESFETGNILLWLDPTATLNGMFGNRISTAFILDLLLVVLVFFYWTHREGKKHQIKRVWLIWILTLLFGMAGTFPLFLHWREKAMKSA